MSRHRTLPPVMQAPTHSGLVKPCLVMTDCAVHTITLPEGSFTAIVNSAPGVDGLASIFILDRDEVEAHIMLLQNAMEDAQRTDAGKMPLHAHKSTLQ